MITAASAAQITIKTAAEIISAAVFLCILRCFEFKSLTADHFVRCLFLWINSLTAKNTEADNNIPTVLSMISLMSNALPNTGCSNSISNTDTMPAVTVFFQDGLSFARGCKKPNGKNIRKFPITSPLMLLKKSMSRSKAPQNHSIERPECIGYKSSYHAMPIMSSPITRHTSPAI